MTLTKIVIIGVATGAFLFGTLLELVAITKARLAESVGLVCDNANYDFGRAWFTEAGNLEHRFVLRNLNPQAIHISKARSSCGCTVPTVSNVIIAGGGQAEIPVRINWTTRSGPQQSTVLMTTDSPTQPQILLTAQAFVEVGAALSPNTINFGDLRPGERVIRTVSLASGALSAPFRVTSVEGVDENLRISRVEARGVYTAASIAGPPGDFLIALTAPRFEGHENAKIIFHTDLSGQKELMLYVSGTFEPLITAQPQSLLFPYDSAQHKTVIKQMLLVANGEHAPPGTFRAEVGGGVSPSPFSILSLISSEHDGRSSARVTVGFTPNQTLVGGGFVRGEINVAFGTDTLSVPLWAADLGKMSDPNLQNLKGDH